MSELFADWIKETSTTTGTGTLTLAAAASGFARFSAAFATNDIVPYVIEASNGDREAGLGTVGAGNTLARTTVTATLVGGTFNNTSPSAITLPAGTHTVYCSPTATAFTDKTKGPVSAVDEDIAVFDGTTGKIVKDGGVKVNSLEPALGNPTVDGHALVSQTNGTRSWEAKASIFDQLTEPVTGVLTGDLWVSSDVNITRINVLNALFTMTVGNEASQNSLFGYRATWHPTNVFGSLNPKTLWGFEIGQFQGHNANGICSITLGNPSQTVQLDGITQLEVVAPGYSATPLIFAWSGLNERYEVTDLPFAQWLASQENQVITLRVRLWAEIYNNVSQDQFGNNEEKTSPVAADRLLIEDSEASGAKRYVQISNLPAGAVDLSNAAFPDSAHFASEVVADATVAFTDSNKQSVDASTHASLTLSAPGIGNYVLRILNSGSLSGITPTPLWDSGNAPVWAGTSILSLYYDGTNWYGSAIVGAA